jgi:hypothetical protein
LLAGWTMKLLAATLRLDIRDECGIGNAAEPCRPSSMSSGTTASSPFRPHGSGSAAGHRKTVALTSASHDGDMVARAMAVFGLGAVRGSSSRRGVAALVGLKRALQEASTSASRPTDRAARATNSNRVSSTRQATGAPIIPIHVRFLPHGA